LGKLVLLVSEETIEQKDAQKMAKSRKSPLFGTT